MIVCCSTPCNGTPPPPARGEAAAAEEEERSAGDCVRSSVAVEVCDITKGRGKMFARREKPRFRPRNTHGSRHSEDATVEQQGRRGGARDERRKQNAARKMSLL